MDPSIVNDSRKFWWTVEPLLSDMVQVPTSLTLLGSKNRISNDKEVAEVFNNHFANITDALGIKKIIENISSASEIVDPMDTILPLKV